jgi:hypothetical protein
VSEPLPPEDAHTGDTEEVDAVLVAPAPSGRALALPAGAAAILPAVQAAAVAATGFVAGAAMVGMARRRHDRRAFMRTPSKRRRGGRGEVVQIVGSRSLLVDVHLLGGRR